MQRQGCREAEQYFIGPEKIAELHPLLNMDSILAALHNPGNLFKIRKNKTFAIKVNKNILHGNS